MQRAMLPFNIELLKLTPELFAPLTPVTSLDYYETVNGPLHQEGLFSVAIFGRVGDELRDVRFSYIDIGTTVLHPTIYHTLVQLKGLYQGIMAGSIFAKWDEKEKDFIQVDNLHGDTGYSFFLKHWKNIVHKRTKSPIRDIRIKLIEKYKDRGLVNRILVLPAGLRDIEVDEDGRTVIGEINTYYRKILAISRTIADSRSGPDAPALDLSRHSIQLTFNEAYTYFTNMLEGKGGFVQNRWGARRVASGTRNVISAMNASTALMGSKRSPKFTDTIVGMYQLAIAMLPITIFQLRTRYLEAIFGFGDGKARLVDPQTYKGSIVEVPPEIYDDWTTNEGLEKFVNAFGELTTRKRPVSVGDYYLALIYRGPDKTFRIFSDIDELPPHLNKDDVHPINQMELLYLSGYPIWNKYYAFITRYPVTGTGSTYPSSIYVKTTTEGEERRELGVNWEPLGDDAAALEFPRPDINTYVDSLVLSSSRLAGLGADQRVNFQLSRYRSIH